MINKVLDIKSKRVEDIINSSASLTLLEVYSKLYLGGGQPRTCEKSMRLYYHKIILTGLEQAKKYEKMNERTCKPKWRGLRFIDGNHYSNESITDEQAIKLLKKGSLKESDFKVLPAGLNEPKKETWADIKEKQSGGKKPTKKKTTK